MTHYKRYGYSKHILSLIDDFEKENPEISIGECTDLMMLHERNENHYTKKLLNRINNTVKKPYHFIS
jgi:hypothetical protein